MANSLRTEPGPTNFWHEYYWGRRRGRHERKRRTIEAGLSGVEFLAMNTDVQAQRLESAATSPAWRELHARDPLHVPGADAWVPAEGRAASVSPAGSPCDVLARHTADDLGNDEAA